MDDLFIPKMVDGRVKLTLGNVQLQDVIQRVQFFVAQESQNLVERRLHPVVRFLVGFLFKTHVAAVASRRVWLPEIGEELPASAHLVIGGVADDGFNAVGELPFALVVNLLADGQPVAVDPIGQIGDEGNLALGDVMEDSPLAFNTR